MTFFNNVGMCTNENLKLYSYKDHLSIRNFYKITISGWISQQIPNSNIQYSLLKINIYMIKTSSMNQIELFSSILSIVYILGNAHAFKSTSYLFFFQTFHIKFKCVHNLHKHHN
jgi:hypothetical protein